jgi:YfiH family protein
MQTLEKNGVRWLEFDLLNNTKRLKHGVFLRHGGYSTGSYGSLNLGGLGDSPESIQKNREKICGILGLEQLIFAQQCHGIHVNEVSSHSHETLLMGDAMTTSSPNLGLMINHADCQAAIFYDPMHHAVANVHAGWRGNVQNIYAETVAFMQHRYFSNPADLLVCISPSLGPENSQFVNYRSELPEDFWDFQIKPLYFDLWEISRMQLMRCGILPEHIEIARICTKANPEDYFSHRYDPKAGRHGTVVALI